MENFKHNFNKSKEDIRLQLEKYLSALHSEIQQTSVCHDKAVVRMKIPILYLLLQKYDEALHYFEWYDKLFPDEAALAEFFFARAVTSHYHNQLDKAKACIILTYIQNPYLIGLVVGKENDMTCNGLFSTESKEWAISALETCRFIQNEKFNKWLQKFTISKEYLSTAERMDAINKLLDDEPESSVRNEMVEAISNIWYKQKAIL